jgi:hypothetical protein
MAYYLSLTTQALRIWHHESTSVRGETMNPAPALNTVPTPTKPLAGGRAWARAMTTLGSLTVGGA